MYLCALPNEHTHTKLKPCKTRYYPVGDESIQWKREFRFYVWNSGCGVCSYTLIFSLTTTGKHFVAQLKERPCTQPVWCPRRCEDTGSSPVCLWPPSSRPCRRRCSRLSNRPSSSQTTVAGNPRCLALSTQNYVLSCLIKREAFCRRILLFPHVVKRKVRKNRKWK